MKNLRAISVFTLGLGCAWLLSISTASAYEPLNNENLMSVTHPAPIDTGEDMGTKSEIPLVGGSVFTVTKNAYEGVRIWRFAVDDAYWWVTDKGIIWGTNQMGSFPQAGSDIEAYNVYLSL